MYLSLPKIETYHPKSETWTYILFYPPYADKISMFYTIAYFSSAGNYYLPGFKFSFPGGTFQTLSTPQIPFFPSWATVPWLFLPLRFKFPLPGPQSYGYFYLSDSNFPFLGRSPISIPTSQAQFSLLRP